MAFAVVLALVHTLFCCALISTSCCISLYGLCSCYTEYAALEGDFKDGKLHPGDLKACLTEYINAMLQPIRDHFATGEPKKLLELVRGYRTTR